MRALKDGVAIYVERETAQKLLDNAPPKEGGFFELSPAQIDLFEGLEDALRSPGCSVMGDK